MVLSPAGAPAAYHVQGGRARRPVYVRRGHLADLLTRPLRPPEPDPDFLHHLVHIRVVEAVAAAHLPDHRAETLEHRFDREGEMLLGFGQCHGGSIGLPAPRRQRSDRRSLRQRERLISLPAPRRAAVDDAGIGAPAGGVKQLLDRMKAGRAVDVLDVGPVP